MPGRDIIVVGASAGGVEALIELSRSLPADLPAAVFVVLHVPSNGVSALPQILSRSGPLPATHARNGEAIERGRIYVAQPDCHLLVKRDQVRVARGPRENGHRPAVDPLFRTAARWYGPRVIGVVLSGTLDDGTAGLLAVKQRGGVAVVQDPDEALFSGMPRSALDNVAVDYSLSMREIGPVLASLAHESVEEEAAEPMSEEMRRETDIAELDLAEMQRSDPSGRPSTLTCPECHGGLWELEEGKLLRFRCRVGHAFSMDSLQQQQSAALENALWVALRALEERATFARRLMTRARRSGNQLMAKRFESQTEEAEQGAALIRDSLLSGTGQETATGA